MPGVTGLSLVIPPFTEVDVSAYTMVRETAGLATAFDTPAVGSCFCLDETIILYIDIGSTVARIRVSDAAILDENANFGRGTVANQCGHTSAFGKYMASCSSGEDAIRIWKDGALIQTENRTDVNDEWYGAIVSPSGKYIAVPYWDNSLAIYKVMIWEGA